MTQTTFTPEETTIKELAMAISHKHQHTKLAKSAAEFIFESLARPNQNPLPDLDTLRNFAEFLITKKGYN